MTICISYKFRIYPTNEQKHYFALTFGHARFVYNRLLSIISKRYEDEKKYTSFFDACKIITNELKPNNPWLENVSRMALNTSAEDLCIAFKNIKHGKGYPKFRKRTHDQSYRLTEGYRFRLDESNNSIRLEKIPGLVYCVVSQKLQGKPKFVTVSKTATDKYFVSITCEVDEVNQYPKTGKQVGIDLGIKTLASLSDGTSYANPKAFEQLRKKLAKQQQILSRKKKGSNQYNKQRIKVARVHEKIKNIRNHQQHVITTEIVKNHDVICLETLDVVKMITLGNKDLSRQLSDASLSEFIRKLVYKAKWHNRTIAKVDQYFASSKICYYCKHKKEDITLADRQWTCNKCGKIHDRDHNASKNILNEGLRILQNPIEKKPVAKRSRVRKNEKPKGSTKTDVNVGMSTLESQKVIV